MYIVWRLQKFTYIYRIFYFHLVGGKVRFYFLDRLYRFELNLNSVWGVVEIDSGFGRILFCKQRPDPQNR